MKIKISLVGLCVLMCLMVSSRAQSTLIRPDASVAGRSQAEWSVAWWQWVLSFPENQNPNVDTTGAFSFLGDQGPVFFLAATFGSTPVTRSATVRSDQFLFFPLISTVSWEQISAYGGSEAGLRRDAAETIGIGPAGPSPGTTLFARLDGGDLALPPPTTSLFDFRQMSPPGLTRSWDCLRAHSLRCRTAGGSCSAHWRPETMTCTTVARRRASERMRGEIFLRTIPIV